MTSRRGHSLLIVMMILPLLAVMAGALLNRVDTEIRLARHDIQTLKAELLAEDALALALAGDERNTYETAEGTATVEREQTNDGTVILTCTGQSIRYGSVYTREIVAEVKFAEDGAAKMVSYRGPHSPQRGEELLHPQ